MPFNVAGAHVCVVLFYLFISSLGRALVAGLWILLATGYFGYCQLPHSKISAITCLHFCNYFVVYAAYLVFEIVIS